MNAPRTAKAFENFSKALCNLERTLTLPEDDVDYRNSAVLSFVLAYEQCWKLLRWALIELIALETKGPKPAIQAAFTQGWLGDEDTHWLEMANDRNLVSHTYNEAQAIEIYERVKTYHAPNMRRLADYLSSQYEALRPQT